MERDRKMRLVSFLINNTDEIGILEKQSNTITRFSLVDEMLPKTMLEFIEMGPTGIELAKEASKNARATSKVALSNVRLKAPIPIPKRDIMAVGRNYYEHAEEFHTSGFDATSGKSAIPEFPIIFTKSTTSVTGPFDTISLHLDRSNSTDYEGELAVIIGKKGREIKKQNAFEYVYGYSVSNDLTARSLQQKHKQWFVGKSIDGYCPMGPVLFTKEEAGHPDEFQLTTLVNGQVRQKASCSELIFDIPTLIETISSGITLLPGDIIITGTPVGVGIGFDPPVFLAKGDCVRITIDPIGSIENTME